MNATLLQAKKLLELVGKVSSDVFQRLLSSQALSMLFKCEEPDQIDLQAFVRAIGLGPFNRTRFCSYLEFKVPGFGLHLNDDELYDVLPAHGTEEGVCKYLNVGNDRIMVTGEFTKTFGNEFVIPSQGFTAVIPCVADRQRYNQYLMPVKPFAHEMTFHEFYALLNFLSCGGHRIKTPCFMFVCRRHAGGSKVFLVKLFNDRGFVLDIESASREFVPGESIVFIDKLA